MAPWPPGLGFGVRPSNSNQVPPPVYAPLPALPSRVNWLAGPAIGTARYPEVAVGRRVAHHPR